MELTNDTFVSHSVYLHIYCIEEGKCKWTGKYIISLSDSDRSSTNKKALNSKHMTMHTGASTMPINHMPIILLSYQLKYNWNRFREKCIMSLFAETTPIVFQLV